MSTTADDLIPQLREQGPRRVAKWTEDAFDGFLAGPVANLLRSLKWSDKDLPDPHVVPNYIRMVYEGVGAGWLGIPDYNIPATTFLGHCLQMLVPSAIGNVPLMRRSQVLQQVWNLGEGLAKEPKWLNQYAITQTDWSVDIQKLEVHLAKILAPVLSPVQPSTWSGKLQLSIINLRQKSESFVPGHLYLACPALLCIADRIDPQQNLAILLRKHGKSELLGAVGRLPEYTETFDSPKVAANSDDITINSQRIDAPLLSAPQQVLCVEAGFVAVTAVDSQRLWLVDAA